MKYQERILLTEEGMSLIESGKSFTDITNVLKEKEYYEYDIRKVISSVKKNLDEKYCSQFTASLLLDTTELRDTTFAFLSEDVYEFICANETKKH